MMAQPNSQFVTRIPFAPMVRLLPSRVGGAGNEQLLLLSGESQQKYAVRHFAGLAALAGGPGHIINEY